MDVKPGNYTNFLSKGMITESRKTKTSRARQFASLFLTIKFFFFNGAVFHFVTRQNHTFRGSSTNAVINVKSKDINKKLRGAQPVNGPFSTKHFAYPEPVNPADNFFKDTTHCLNVTCIIKTRFTFNCLCPDHFNIRRFI